MFHGIGTSNGNIILMWGFGVVVSNSNSNHNYNSFHSSFQADGLAMMVGFCSRFVPVKRELFVFSFCLFVCFGGWVFRLLLLSQLRICLCNKVTLLFIFTLCQ